MDLSEKISSSLNHTFAILSPSGRPLLISVIPYLQRTITSLGRWAWTSLSFIASSTTARGEHVCGKTSQLLALMVNSRLCGIAEQGL
jgi:hypothetical protein